MVWRSEAYVMFVRRYRYGENLFVLVFGPSGYHQLAGSQSNIISGEDVFYRKKVL